MEFICPKLNQFEKSFLALFLCFFLWVPTYAQCPDFLDLSSPNCTCTYGNDGRAFQYTGISSGRHTIISAPGYDSHVGGNQLQMLPPGENMSIKLGNENVGFEAETIVICSLIPYLNRMCQCASQKPIRHS